MTKETSRPILHGSNLSPYVRKVRVALAYEGIECDDTHPWGLIGPGGQASAGREIR